MNIEINLDRGNIEKRANIEKEEFSKWLSKNHRTFKGIESDISERGGDIDNILMMLAVMGIEIDTATNYSKKGEIETAGYTLAQSKRTKDDIYSQLMQTYGMVDSEGKIKSLNFLENLNLWRDYVTQKYDGSIRQCEFLLNNANLK